MADDYIVAGATFRAVDIGSKLYQAVLGPTSLPHAVDFTESQTGEAIWTPASGKKFVITGWHLVFSAAGVITVWETATNNLAGRVFQQEGAAAGAGSTIGGMHIWSRAADNVLKYTSGAGAAGSLAVYGYEA
jgi:hypothetical protein